MKRLRVLVGIVCIITIALHAQEGLEQTIKLSVQDKFSEQFWEELEPCIDKYRALRSQQAKMRITRQEGTYRLQERALERKIKHYKQVLHNIIGDPNAKKEGGWGLPLLSNALYFEKKISEKVAWLLLECGAGPNLDTEFGAPIFCAKTVAMAELLIRHGADIKKHSNRGILLANSMSRNYPVKLIEFYLAQGLDVNEKDKNNFTALHRLGFSARDYTYSNKLKRAMEQKVELLLAKGALVNEVDSIHNRTPIDCALQCYYGDSWATNRFITLLRAAGGKTAKELGIQ